VRLASVYVPNGREVGHEHYYYKLDWLGRLRNHLDKHYTPDELLVVMGDWNIMPADIDVWSPKAFEGSTHVTPPEREALQTVKDWGLVDTFRERYEDVPGLYSYWDYRAGDFHQKRGLRIDYLLASRALAELNRSDLIDRNTRKGSKPSDHAAVLSWYDVEV
jgi:exodeoxyribonuclease-3